MLFSAHKYHSRAEFISDITLIATNCEQYNGAESELTKDARVLVDFTRKALNEVNSMHNLNCFIVLIDIERWNILNYYLFLF